MEFLGKIEKTVLGWFKGVPGLPPSGRKWLGDNVWWIALIAAILTGIGILINLITISASISVLGSIAATYYTSAAVTTWVVVTGIVGLAFAVIEGVLLAVAVSPLKEKQKKGWVLLFASWLVGVVGVVVNSLLTLNVFSFIFGIIFGAVWAAIIGYFLVEMHGQFSHVERSRGVRKAK